jgi:fumarylacetoacetase
VRFGACQQLDFELEVGAFIGPGNKQGEPFTIKMARTQLFGYCLLNDWSARDIQRWETNPLGPFLGKSFCTTISPWVITDEAMIPFRAHAFPRAEADPPAMDYLKDAADEAEGLFDLALDAYILTARMRNQKAAPARITESNFKYVYWSFAQMATHHASNGCNLAPGDLLGSGTASGPTDESRACLLEATVRGNVPLVLPDGETRAWLEDGDEVVFRARAKREGHVSIGFGECRGRIEPAPAWPAG